MPIVTDLIDKAFGDLVDSLTAPPEGDDVDTSVHVCFSSRKLTRDFIDINQPDLASIAQVGTHTQVVRAAGVILALNPRVITYEWPKRIARQDTIKGTVFHHFTNNLGQNNDVLVLRLQGSTGCIDPDSCESPSEKRQALIRLETFHRLYDLTRQEMLFLDGRPNVFWLNMQTPLFPLPVTFTGFFSKVLTYSEDAGKPHSRDFSVDFTVQNIDPPDMLSSVLGAIGTARGAITGTTDANATIVGQ